MARGQSKLRGFDQAVRNLNKEIAKIKGRTLEGAIQATIHIRRSVDLKRPLVPVDLGNLRASWFTVTSQAGGSELMAPPTFVGDDDLVSKLNSTYQAVVAEQKGRARDGKNIVVIFGFGAYYAQAVHAMKDAKFKRPGAEAEFLQAHLTGETSELLRIIADYARIK